MKEAMLTPGPWTYGVRKDGSIWISRGDPKTGPHYQADFCGTEADARLSCAAPLLLQAAEAHAAWAYAEEGHGLVSTFNERMELCNYAEYLTNKALAIMRGEPLPETHEGVPRIVVRFPLVGISRVDESEIRSSVDRLLAAYRDALKFPASADSTV
ncbi:hypothetical protein QYH69_32340 [Paraburkholderia sp. SARCC-3016]|uniref:hypothetical protein n=1 Tax=Paraburkholderia sp. SARCC-3016 TaxID=3058611 RepID=UPI00280721F2|nr:hypothetical protein [Paraburkholderia sp. SARCC-3016]MDQ7981914.1 hypothetical protein [Paraburkholderia sp. SARCC-3016]